MQPTSIPAGEHNPRGHSSAEVVAALTGRPTWTEYIADAQITGMGSILVDQGAQVGLETLTENDHLLRLFVNDVTSGLTQEEVDALTEADMVEASFVGYSARPLTAGAWTASSQFAFYVEQDFVSSANQVTPQTVYGYYITRAVDGMMLMLEYFTESQDISASGQVIGVIPRITFGEGSLDAGYGPLYYPGRSWEVEHADDGTRQEGSDWNDYLGVVATYVGDGTDNPEAHQIGCLDCSGFVRMVYGYHGGIPMTLSYYLDGTHLPRVSFNIALYGPGVVVASGTGAPPSLAQLQVGDILAWDADTSNPDEEEGQIDHVGIYLGVDSAGNHRFISSRKTVNGPSMANVGGPSILDGTGLYARSLRLIRRI